MNRRRLLAVSTAFTVGMLAGCVSDWTDDTTEPNPSTPAGPLPDIDDETLATVIRNSNGFTVDLFHQLADDADESGTPNVFASPLSVTTALAMTYAGARGNTRDEMREALRYQLGTVDNTDGEDAAKNSTNDDTESNDTDSGSYSDGPPNEALHGGFAELLEQLNQRGTDLDPEDIPSAYDEDDDPVPFDLSVVNAVWGLEGYPFLESYLELLNTFYGAGLQEVDYENDAEGARKTINEWVAEQTGERIENLLPRGALDELTRLVLTNAIFFKANWANPFDESDTQYRSFRTGSAESVDVPMMKNGDVTLPYGETTLDAGDVQAVELPYVGNEVSMVVILPESGDFEAISNAIDGSALGRILADMERRDGRVELPRFEFESGFELRPALENLGMVDAFDRDRADLGGMYDTESTPENLFVDEVYHESFVAVDEKGTEAAAATAVVVSADSASMDPFEFVANRPFLFFIRDRPTEAILFMGRVTDPLAE